MTNKYICNHCFKYAWKSYYGESYNDFHVFSRGDKLIARCELCTKLKLRPCIVKDTIVME